MLQPFKTNPVIEMRLRAHGLHRIGDYHPGTVIACNKGILWVTQSGDRRDYVLLPGDQFASRKRGKILIEAMHDSAIRIAMGEKSQASRNPRLTQGKPI